ncbi:rhomboid family intramembrane serine protease [Maritalea sp.]|uniref:rhomboid family intramembrane serine protease n=1 Tax=Maritalea sp. TaxID=2003361 RepID=UPI003EF79896
MNFPPEQNDPQKPQGQPPAFNLPFIVTITVGLLFLIHLAATLMLSADSYDLLFVQFGYITQRDLLPVELRGGEFARYYSLFSHAFLHVGWQHLIFNIAWLVVFGSPVAQRYGNIGFIAVFLFGSAVGALVFAAMSGGGFSVLIGASGAVSAFIGGATRFVFQPPQTRLNPETGEVVVVGRKLASLIEIVKNKRAFGFAGFWLVLNVVFGVAPGLMGVDGSVAWQAHLGGFVAGYFMVAWLEHRAF